MKECRDLKELHPKVEEMANELVKRCITKGLILGIGETYRSIERQDYLYEQGRSRPGQIVTYAKGNTKSSYHQWRLAVDFFQNIKGKEYEPKFLEAIGEIAEEIGFEWGGRWLMGDSCHLQVTFGLSIEELRSGAKIPELEPTSTYIAAVEKLYRKEILTDKELWTIPRNIKPKHIEALIIKVACAIQ